MGATVKYSSVAQMLKLFFLIKKVSAGEKNSFEKVKVDSFRKPVAPLKQMSSRIIKYNISDNCNGRTFLNLTQYLKKKFRDCGIMFSNLIFL